MTLGGYFFVIAPKGTPDEVVNLLHCVFKKGLKSESFRPLARKSGFVLDYQGPAELKQRLAADYALFERHPKTDQTSIAYSMINGIKRVDGSRNPRKPAVSGSKSTKE